LKRYIVIKKKKLGIKSRKDKKKLTRDHECVKKFYKKGQEREKVKKALDRKKVAKSIVVFVKKNRIFVINPL